MRPDAIVVGGGLLGCLCALRLAERGLRVTVLERSVPGAEASTAAAGILSPLAESHSDDHALTMGVRSRELHATLAEELRESTGIDVGFRRCGVLRLAFSAQEVEALETQANSLRARHHAVETLDAKTARALETNIAPAVAGALHFSQEAQLDPKQLVPAVALAAERKGVRFITGATVRNICVEHSVVRGVVVDGELHEAAHVIVAAGSWTTLVPGLNLDANVVFPIRGQLISTQTRPPLFENIVFSEGGYVVTRPNGRVLCGSTEERVGFRRGVTLSGMRSVVDIATQIAPSLADAPIESHWSSFRPATADGRPLVGETHTDNLFLASGHFRNGILLAPISARWIADAVTGAAVPPEAHALRPTRFEATTSA